MSWAGGGSATGRTGELAGAFPEPFDLAGPSFSTLLARHLPQAAPDLHGDLHGELPRELTPVEGTTVLACAFAGGIVIAGDRRATAVNVISKRDMRKVFEADSWSAVAISGVAGPAMELAKVFATELEHYEKVENGALSLEGKSNKLGQMVRANLPLAMQGLVVVPLFAGYDTQAGEGRIYEFDAAGGRYEEARFASQGSGARDARGSLKGRYHPDLQRDETVDVALEALWDAADEDSATGGPDLVRGIYPLVAVIDADGYRELAEDDVAARVDRVISARSE
jgi:proteasome beta subunit